MNDIQRLRLRQMRLRGEMRTLRGIIRIARARIDPRNPQKTRGCSGCLRSSLDFHLKKMQALQSQYVAVENEKQKLIAIEAAKANKLT